MPVIQIGTTQKHPSFQDISEGGSLLPLKTHDKRTMIIELDLNNYEYLQTLCLGDSYGFIEAMELEELTGWPATEDQPFYTSK